MVESCCDESFGGASADSYGDALGRRSCEPRGEVRGEPAAVAPLRTGGSVTGRPLNACASFQAFARPSLRRLTRRFFDRGGVAGGSGGTQPNVGAAAGSNGDRGEAELSGGNDGDDASCELLAAASPRLTRLGVDCVAAASA